MTTLSWLETILAAPVRGHSLDGKLVSLVKFYQIRCNPLAVVSHTHIAVYRDQPPQGCPAHDLSVLSHLENQTSSIRAATNTPSLTAGINRATET